MKHAREDYNRIQDPAGLIPKNEPVFLVRGQDLVGGDTVRDWAMRAHKAGASTDIVILALNQARAMDEWVRTVARKTPDLPVLQDPFEPAELAETKGLGPDGTVLQDGFETDSRTL